MKLYLKALQKETLAAWLCTSCWLYNRALEQRIKAYQRRGESISFIDQCHWLTCLRQRIQTIKNIPVNFGRDALRRVGGILAKSFVTTPSRSRDGFSENA